MKQHKVRRPRFPSTKICRTDMLIGAFSRNLFQTERVQVTSKSLLPKTRGGGEAWGKAEEKSIAAPARELKGLKMAEQLD